MSLCLWWIGAKLGGGCRWQGEGQVEMGRADGLEVVKDGREAWTEGPERPEDRPWEANTWGHRQVQQYMEEWTVLTKSRRQSGKSSGGAGGLGDRAVDDDGGPCRDCGGGVADMLLQAILWFGPQNHRHDGLSCLVLKT